MRCFRRSIVPLVTLFGLVSGVPDAVAADPTWEARYDGSGEDVLNDVALSPDGTTLFAVGSDGADLLVVAYDTATGEPEWDTTWDSGCEPACEDVGVSVAVNPDGTSVFVAVDIRRPLSFITPDIGTVAIDASTGTVSWGESWGAYSREDEAEAIAVAPDGSAVYTAGTKGYNSADGIVVARYAETGALLWEAEVDETTRLLEFGKGVATSPDGTRVYLTGTYDCCRDDTIRAGVWAFRAATGSLVWRGTSPGCCFHGFGDATWIDVGSDGAVYIASSTVREGHRTDFALSRFSARGKRQWTFLYDGPDHGADGLKGIIVAPNGKRVFIAGNSANDDSGDVAVIAVNAADGTKLWVRRWNAPGARDAESVADIAVAAGVVAVTGWTPGIGEKADDVATVAYDLAGVRLLSARYASLPVGTDDRGRSVKVTPTGAVIVAGSGGTDALVLSYAT